MLLGNDAQTALGIPITIKEKSVIVTNVVFIALLLTGLLVYWKLSTKLMVYSTTKVYHNIIFVTFKFTNFCLNLFSP